MGPCLRDPRLRDDLPRVAQASPQHQVAPPAARDSPQRWAPARDVTLRAAVAPWVGRHSPASSHTTSSPSSPSNSQNGSAGRSRGSLWFPRREQYRCDRSRKIGDGSPAGRVAQPRCLSLSIRAASPALPGQHATAQAPVEQSVLLAQPQALRAAGARAAGARARAPMQPAPRIDTGHPPLARKSDTGSSSQRTRA